MTETESGESGESEMTKSKSFGAAEEQVCLSQQSRCVDK